MRCCCRRSSASSAAALLLLALKFVVRKPALYAEPKGQAAPPWWIRGLLILTCTGVSFAHGSNDGQKGMGLIMLILIGTVPTAYALNRALPASHLASFSQGLACGLQGRRGEGRGLQCPRRSAPGGDQLRRAASDQRGHLSLARRADAATSPQQVESYGSIAKIPFAAVGNTRNDMYLASEALRFLAKDKAAELTDADKKVAERLQGRSSTRRPSSSRSG